MPDLYCRHCGGFLPAMGGACRRCPPKLRRTFPFMLGIGGAVVGLSAGVLLTVSGGSMYTPNLTEREGVPTKGLSLVKDSRPLPAGPPVLSSPSRPFNGAPVLGARPSISSGVPVLQATPIRPSGAPLLQSPRGPRIGRSILQSPSAPSIQPTVTLAPALPPHAPGATPDSGAILAYLRQIEAIEARRMGAVTDLVPGLLTLSSLQGMVGRKGGSPDTGEGNFDPTSLTMGGDTMNEYRAKVRQVRQMIRRVRPPAAAARFHATYAAAVDAYDGIIGQILDAMLQRDMSLGQRMGQFQSGADAPFIKADRELGHLLERYRLPRTFSIGNG